MLCDKKKGKKLTKTMVES